MIDLADDLELIRQAAIDAGALALAEREAGLKIEAKPGGSPVTSGDLKVDALLRDQLLGARPDYGWLSEETADSPDRDLRNDRWSSVEVPSNPGRKASATIERPAQGFRAYLMEAEFATKAGHTYKLSTEARVLPDTTPKP